MTEQDRNSDKEKQDRELSPQDRVESPPKSAKKKQGIPNFEEFENDPQYQDYEVTYDF